LDPVEIFSVMALAAAAALTQSLSGFGFSLFIVPLLIPVVGAKEAVVLANLLGVFVNVITLARLRPQVDWRLGGTLLGGAALGMPLGVAVLSFANPDVLQAGIAVTVLISTLALWRGLRLHAAGRLGNIGAGFVSGVLNTSTSMSGPPVVLYLQGRGIPPAPFRATLGAFFLASALLAAVLFAIAGRMHGSTLALTAFALPAMVVGWLGGYVVVNRVNDVTFRRIVMVVLIATAVSALAGPVAKALDIR
jgi:uncharacterized membrane protein YfcA